MLDVSHVAPDVPPDEGDPHEEVRVPGRPRDRRGGGLAPGSRPEVASAAGSAVSAAASAAKEKVSSSSTDADEPIVAEDSTAVAGGDAEVGEDKPLSS